MGRLDGKLAVVMGAIRAGNMGQAIARRFIEEGATVVVSGRGEAGRRQFATQTGASALPCEGANRGQIQALADATIDRHGGIDIAVMASIAAHQPA